MHTCETAVWLQTEGEVTYNGRGFREFRVQRTAAYVEQEDVHMGELTVRETFDFAARCMGAGTKAGVFPGRSAATLS